MAVQLGRKSPIKTEMLPEKPGVIVEGTPTLLLIRYMMEAIPGQVQIRHCRTISLLKISMQPKRFGSFLTPTPNPDPQELEEIDLFQRLPNYREYMNAVPRFLPRFRK